MVTTTLAGRFKETADDLYQFVQDKLDQHLGQPMRAKPVSAICRSVESKPGHFVIEVSSAEMPGWSFRRTRSDRHLGVSSKAWAAFKEECGADVDRWFQVNRPAR